MVRGFFVRGKRTCSGWLEVVHTTSYDRRPFAKLSNTAGKN